MTQITNSKENVPELVAAEKAKMLIEAETLAVKYFLPYVNSDQIFEDTSIPDNLKLKPKIDMLARISFLMLLMSISIEIDLLQRYSVKAVFYGLDKMKIKIIKRFHKIYKAEIKPLIELRENILNYVEDTNSEDEVFNDFNNKLKSIEEDYFFDFAFLSDITVKYCGSFKEKMNTFPFRLT